MMDVFRATSVAFAKQDIKSKPKDIYENYVSKLLSKDDNLENFEIVNPELYIATLDSPDAHLVIEFNVEKGAGYISASSNDGYPIGVLPVDSIFTPVSKVSYAVEPMRVGQVTDYEKLIVEIWTDGTIMPSEALIESGNILVKSATLLTTIGTTITEGGEEDTSSLSLIHI